jgi:hypothetical protein
VHGSDKDGLVVVDLATRTISTTIVLGGQPDSVAISADGRYAAIAIENERDEDMNDGEMPQPPAGFLTIVDLIYRLEKIEGAALTKSGELLVVNDNDGAGETRLLRLHGVISRHPPR